MLSRVDVSHPAIALGIAVMAVGGHLFFGEPVSAMKIFGIAVIAAEVLLVARS